MRALQYLVSFGFVALGTWLVVNGTVQAGMIALCVGGVFAATTYFVN